MSVFDIRKLELELNPEQFHAVTDNYPRILCLAGAGTGKTKCLVYRILHKVYSGVDPQSILVLTFTNAAAVEMKQRYIQYSNTDVCPQFRTFHSFCYTVLCNNKDVLHELGYRTIPSIADDMQVKKINLEAQTILGFKVSYNKLKRNITLTPKELYQYELFEKTISRLLIKYNLITFDRLCYDICKLFIDNDESILKYKSQYKYIFVDEFQDTDIIQYKFVESFINSNIFVVGDALQSIYGFRGANSSIIKQLSKDDIWHTIKLYQNYRCPPVVCEFANKNSKHAEDSYKIDIQANKTSGDCIVKISKGCSTSGSVCSDDIVYCIQDMKQHKGSFALLCRTNREVDSIKQYLMSHGVRLQQSENNDMITNIIDCIINPDITLDLLANNLSTQDYSNYIRLRSLLEKDGKSYTVEDLIKDFQHIHSIKHMYDILIHIDNICKLENRTIKDKCIDIISDILGEYNSDISEDLDSIDNIFDGLRFIQKLISQDSKHIESNIHVGTIHSVKGLEFDNVYVFGVGDSLFKLNNEENKNLYYVAITRAKHHLVVFERKYHDYRQIKA